MLHYISTSHTYLLLNLHDSEHSLAAMGGYCTMEEYRVSVIDNLCIYNPRWSCRCKKGCTTYKQSLWSGRQKQMGHP